MRKTKEDIEKIRKDIPEEYLKQFDNTLKQKKIAVCKIVGEVCSGCKMKVSAMTMDNIKKGIEMVKCDNCGRILYKDENEVSNLKKAK